MERITSHSLETVFAFGEYKNRKHMKKVFDNMVPQYEICLENKSKAEIKYKTGETKTLDQYIFVLRKKNKIWFINWQIWFKH